MTRARKRTSRQSEAVQSKPAVLLGRPSLSAGGRFQPGAAPQAQGGAGTCAEEPGSRGAGDRAPNSARAAVKLEGPAMHSAWQNAWGLPVHLSSAIFSPCSPSSLAAKIVLLFYCSLQVYRTTCFKPSHPHTHPPNYPWSTDGIHRSHPGLGQETHPPTPSAGQQPRRRI